MNTSDFYAWMRGILDRDKRMSKRMPPLFTPHATDYRDLFSVAVPLIHVGYPWVYTEG